MKKMIGRYFSIIGDEVECTYLCPYCNEETTASFELMNEEQRALVTEESWFEELECGNCGKTSQVRFHQSMRV